MRTAVLTISDRCSRGEREDRSGPLLAELAQSIGAQVEDACVVPDERAQIEHRLRAWSDSGRIDLVLTTGGTGLARRDVTPEATRAVIDREAPGIAEAMRAHGSAQTPFAMLSRQVVGLRGATLIVNFPGSTKAIEECFDAVRATLPHAVRLAAEEGADEHPR